MKTKTDAPAGLRETHSPQEIPLQIETDQFRQAGYRLIDRIAEHLRSLPDGKVTLGEDCGQIRQVLGSDRGVPEEGSDPALLLEQATDLLFRHSLFNGHPRFWGYITASAAPIGILADLLASAVNPNVGGFRLSPAATEIEAQTVRWIAELLGFPVSAGGLLTSGGNVANMVCFMAARTRIGGAGLRVSGLSQGGERPLRVYASEETHTWIQKAADLTGIGTDSIRWIGTDSDLRLDLDSLRTAIRQDRQDGAIPMLVVGTAGSVSTGTVDPLPEIGRLCRQEGIWFHVDGAYGAPAVLADDVPGDLLGLSDADSLAVDPHKWLYAPLEAGCALVRDPVWLRDAFSYHPPYYHMDLEAINYFDLGVQNSRGFRALKVWLQLQHAGRKGYRKMISQDIGLAEHLFRELEKYAELEAFTRSLSIATFRYCPADLRPQSSRPEVLGYLNRLNSAILKDIEESGLAFLSNAVIRGQFLLRLCVVNFRTTREDIEALPGLVCEVGRKLDLGLRPSLGTAGGTGLPGRS